MLQKSSWSLSRLTHGEESWKNSRINVQESENSDNKILLDDIKKRCGKDKNKTKATCRIGDISLEKNVQISEETSCAYCCGDCGWSDSAEVDNKGRI